MGSLTQPLVMIRIKANNREAQLDAKIDAERRRRATESERLLIVVWNVVRSGRYIYSSIERNVSACSMDLSAATTYVREYH